MPARLSLSKVDYREASVRRVLIVQPYVPQYRVALFEKLERRLSERDLRLEVCAAMPTGPQAARSDNTDVLPFQRTVRSRSISFGSRSVRVKRLGSTPTEVDLVIAELGSGVLENYLLALRPSVKFATWGHGFAAVSAINWLDTRLERWQLRHSRRYFAYTESGRRAAVDAGFADDRITVLNNTFDTSELVDPLMQPNPGEIEAFRTTHRLGPGPVAAFIGGLDESKRLDFLIESGERVHQAVPDFVLVVAGNGPLRAMVEEKAAGSSWLRFIGRAGDAEKRLLRATSSLLMNPGRVGLVAVDSFALGLPIVTTEWPFHAPEFDYLVPDTNAVITPDSVETYADTVASLLMDRNRLDVLQAQCLSVSSKYSLDAMVARFEDGIVETLGPAGENN